MIALRKFKIILFVLVLALFASIANAVGPYPATSDIYVDGASTTQTTNPLILDGSDIGAGCNSWTVYLQWTGLGSVSEAISTATVSLVTGLIASSGGTGTLTLYETTDDSMPSGGIGPSLQSVPIGTEPSSGTTITFPTSAGLVTYLNTARTGDGTATFAVKWSACTSITLSFQDNSTGDPPLLSLFNSTPVTLTTFHAADTAPVNWPLYAGIAVIAILALTGAVALRRRSA